MIFTVAIISPSTTGLNAGSVANVIASSMRLSAVDRLLVDHQHAGLVGEQVGAAGEGAIDMHPLPRHRLGDLGRGLVLGDVARLEPRHHDVLDAGRLQRRDLRRPDQRALLEHERALADGVDGGGAFGVARRDRAELHAAPHAGSSRSRWVISPMIATAISAGDTAPMSSPIGEWMRPMSLSVKPRSLFSRSTRRAWVFREPSAPM